MATLYVNVSGGNDSRTYAQAQVVTTPWLTIAKAMADCLVGDTVEIRGGTYPNTFGQDVDGAIFQNYAGEAVIIRRTTTGNAWTWQSSRRCTIRKNPLGGSITIENTSATLNGNGAGILMTAASPTFTLEDMVVDGVIVRDIPGYGIRIDGQIDPIIQNCDISECGMGIRLLGCTDGYVQDNHVYQMDRMIVSDVTAGNDNGGLGIAIDSSSGTPTGGTIVQRNLIHGCHAVSIDYGVDGGAIEIFGSNSVQFLDNVSYDNEGFFETGTPNDSTNPCTGHVLAGNLHYGGTSYITPAPGLTPALLLRAFSGGLIYNNTFVCDDGREILRIEESNTSFDSNLNNMSIRNNIFVSNHASTKIYHFDTDIPTTSTGIVIDYNLCYNTTGGSAIIARRAGGGSEVTYAGTALSTAQSYFPYFDHDIWNQDPQFVNAGSDDYRLKPTSPAVNMGVAIVGYTDGYQGLAPDMGYSERSETKGMMGFF